MRSPLKIVLTTLLTLTVVTPTWGSSWHKMKAELFGPDVDSAKAVYRDRDRDDGLERRFQAKVENAVPGTSFDVWIGDYFVGSMVANSAGRAVIKLRTAQHIDDPGDGDPMPLDFPTPQSTDAVVAGWLAGFMFNQDDDAWTDSQKLRLRSDLVGPTVMEGDVKYIERFKKGRLLRRFKVEIEDGNLGDTYDILVNGLVVGSITLDDDVETKFELRTPEFIDDPGDGLPMPDGFPSLVEGDVVTIGPLTAVLEED